MSTTARMDDHSSRHQSGFRSLDPWHKSAACPPSCPRTCGHCSEQYLIKQPGAPEVPSKPEVHDDERATSEIDELLSKVENNLAYMNKKIEDYGSVIATRWTKRSNEQKRKTMLLRAKPQLYPRKYTIPDLVYSTDLKKALFSRPLAAQTLQNVDEISLNPFLDLPSLVEDKMKLLALIYYRASSSPIAWMMFDLKQARLLCQSARLRIGFNPHCMMLHGEDFGKLVQWEQDACHRRDVIGYPAARLALIAQAELTKFLCRMIDLILEGDLSASVRGRKIWDMLAADQFREQALDRPVCAYFESAFTSPPQFDVKHLITLFQSRLRAAEDDLWLMQTNPLRFRDFVDRTIQSVKLPGADVQRLKHIVIHLCLKPLTKLPMLRWILAKLHRLDEITPRAQTYDHASTHQVGEYEYKLRLLEMGVRDAFQNEMKRLGTMLVSSTAFHGHIVFERGPAARIVSSPRGMWKKDQLIWNIGELQTYRNPHSMPTSFHFACIDEILAKASSKDSARLDQVLYDYLSDLAALTEARAAFNYHSHFDTSFTYDDKRDALVLAEVGEHTGMLQRLITEYWEFDDRMWEKLEQLLSLPKPSAQLTEQSISRSKDLQEALDAFWQEVHDLKTPLLKKAVPEDLSQEEYDQYVRDVSIGKDTEFKTKLAEDGEKALQTLRKKEAHNVAPPEPHTNGSSPFTIHSDSYAPADLATTSAIPKVKVKTRPHEPSTSDVSDETAQKIESLPLTGKSEQRALDRKDSLVVFKLMFSRDGSKHGMTKWPRFVAALKDAGLSATYNGGSAVIFSDQRTGKGAVGFHVPHPDPDIHVDMLREMGKRLTKWFGWNEDTFFLRSKTEQ